MHAFFGDLAQRLEAEDLNPPESVRMGARQFMNR